MIPILSTTAEQCWQMQHNASKSTCGSIDKGSTGSSYHFKNLTVRIFDDRKYVNTNQSTIITEISQVTGVQMDNLQIKDNLLIAKILEVDIKKSICCVACKNSVPDTVGNEEDIFTCTHCNITTLRSLCNLKMVAQIILKTSTEVATYTCFNNGVLRSLKILGHNI